MLGAPIALLIGLLKNLWPLFKGIGNVIAWLFKPLGNLITRFGGFGNIISKVLPWIGRFGKGLLRFLGPVGLIISTLWTLKDAFGLTWAQIGDGIMKFWEWVVSYIPGPVKTLGKVIGKVFDFIGGKTEETTSKMKTDTTTALTGMNTDFSTNFASMFQTTNTKTGQMASTLSTRASAMANSASTNLFGIKNSFLTNFTESDSILSGKLSEMNSSVDTGMFDMFSTTDGSLSGMSGLFDTNLGNMSSDTSTNMADMNSTTSQQMAAMQKSIAMNMRNSQRITAQQTAAMQRITATQMAMQKRAVQTNMKASHPAVVNGWQQSMSYLGSIDLSGVGANIIHGLVRGISSVDVLGAVSSIGSSIIGGFKSFFSIHSPSRVADRDVGQFITLGVIGGILRHKSKAEKAAETVAAAIRKPFTNMEVNGPKVSMARNAYEASRRGTTMSGDYAVQANQTRSNDTPQYAIINIGGHEAKGTVEYITREQKRKDSREVRFKR